MLKIIHMSDIHIGKKFYFLDDDIRNKYKTNIQQTFFRTIKCSKEKGVDAILIAGDLFDNNCPEDVEIKFVIDTFKSVSNIPIFIVPGRNDYVILYKLEKEKVFPSNVSIINNNKKLYTINENCNICGYGYDGPIDNNNINILLCFNDDNQKNINEILNKRFDYIAFGGKHNKDNILNIGNTVIAAYSGSLVSMDFDNSELKGYIYMQIDKDRSYFDFIKCGENIFSTVEIDVSKCRNFKDLTNILDEKLNKEFIYKLKFTGKIEIKNYLKLEMDKVTEKYNNVIEVEDKVEVNYNCDNSILKSIFVNRLRENIEDENLYKKSLKYGFVSMESKV